MSKEIKLSSLTIAFADKLINEGRFHALVTFDTGCDYLYSLADDLKGNRADFNNFADNRPRIAHMGCNVLKGYVRASNDFSLQRYFKQTSSEYLQTLTISAQRLELGL